jgi:glycosyltransferase involved in cell wall biosynthesis
MRVSVIIPNYNYAAYLGYAIESVLSQSEPVDEIIVVDDGSTDHSRDVMESFGDRITAIYQPNGGQASAISAGFARATGDIVCLLDSDDVFFKDKVKTLRQLYRAHIDAGFVFHDLEHMNVERVPAAITAEPKTNNITSRRIDERRIMALGKSFYDAPATSGLTFRRDFIAELFPLPSAQSIYISDHYIKFFALFKGPGLHVDAPLGGQIIHGANLYTGSQPLATKAKIFTNTAVALTRIRPKMQAFAASLMEEVMVIARKNALGDDIMLMADDFISGLSPARRAYFRAKVGLKSVLRR